ncbi:MAG: DUF2752 domain-containing protein [Planctomycetota bacterium]
MIGVLGLTVLVKARTLEPDPRGYGTHEQLGFAPCYFQKLTGKRCPMCGGTTAWAQAARGDVLRATDTNLGATLLFAVVVIGSPWLLWATARRQPPRNWPTWRFMLAMASVWLVVVGLDWLRRLI